VAVTDSAREYIANGRHSGGQFLLCSGRAGVGTLLGVPPPCLLRLYIPVERYMSATNHTEMQSFWATDQQ